MNYVESIRNWLLGKSEVDNYGASVPPVPKDNNPEKLLAMYKEAKPIDKDKIEKKLSKMGYEVKTLYILSKK